MHEMAIVSGLMKILLQQAASHGVTAVKRVNLTVGRLKAVEPEQLRACFELFAEGSCAEGAELVIDHVAVRALCGGCGARFEVQRFRFHCPDCGGGDLSILSGQELRIESFET